MKNLFVNMINIQPGVTIGILLLVICRPFLKKNYKAKLCYMLWLVVALRLALPFDITLPQKAPSITIPVENYYITPSQADNAPVGFEFTPATEYESRPLAPVTSTTPTQNVIEMATRPALSLLDIAVVVWTAVAVGLLSISAVAYLLSKRELLQGAVYDKELTAFLADIAKQLKVTQQVKVCTAHYTGSPMLIGIMEPVIIIPQADYTDSDLAMILCHELTHLKRFDIGYKLLLHILKCAYWFNPLVWLMAKYAQEDIELSCDEDITANRNKDFKARYATAILQVVSRNEGTPVLSTAFSQNAKSVKERFSNIFFGAVKKKGKNVLAVFMVLVIVATTVVGCGSENKIIEQKKDVLVYNIHGLEPVGDKLYEARRDPYNSNGTFNMLVTDLANNKIDFICKLDGCDHKNEQCVSYVTSNSDRVRKLSDGTMLLYSIIPAENYMSKQALYILNEENYAKELLYVFDDGEYQHKASSTMVQIGDNLYFLTSNGTDYAILQLNYKTKETSFLSVDGDLGLVNGDSNNLYFLNQKISESGIIDYAVIKYNLSDNTVTEIYTLTKSYYDNKVSCAIAEGKIYFNYSENDTTYMLSFDPVTNTETYYLQDGKFEGYIDTLFYNVYGDILLFETFDSRLNRGAGYYNTATGEKGMLSITTKSNSNYILFPLFRYNDYFVCTYGGKYLERDNIDANGNPIKEEYYRDTYCFISIEDYLNGNPDFIPIDDIV